MKFIQKNDSFIKSDLLLEYNDKTITHQFPDYQDIIDGISTDENGNGIPDECDIASGTSIDYDLNGEPDECQFDCNENGIPDFYEIEEGLITDCNGNEIPDDFQYFSSDINSDGNLNVLDVVSLVSHILNG